MLLAVNKFIKDQKQGNLSTILIPTFPAINNLVELYPYMVTANTSV